MAPATKERVDVILGWLANQGPQTVLLFFILCGGGYVAKQVIPAHLKQIQDGYQYINAGWQATVEKVETQHTLQIEAISKDRAEERAFWKDMFERQKQLAGALK